MYYQPKAHCQYCGREVPYTMSTEKTNATVGDVSFSYYETKTYCEKCHKPIYVSCVYYNNYRARYKAYYGAAK